MFVLELEAAAVPDVLAPELHWQLQSVYSSMQTAHKVN